MPPRPRTRGGQSPQTWATFLRNHAGDVLACDFLVVVTATFQRIYIFVILDIAEWSIQQFRTASLSIPGIVFSTIAPASSHLSTTRFIQCR